MREIKQAIELATKCINELEGSNLVPFFLAALSSSSDLPLTNVEKSLDVLSSRERDIAEDCLFAIKEYLDLVNTSTPLIPPTSMTLLRNEECDDDVITVELDATQDTQSFLGSSFVPQLPNAINEYGDIVDVSTCIKEGVDFGKILFNKNDFDDFSRKLEACFGPVPLKYNGVRDDYVLNCDNHDFGTIIIEDFYSYK